MRLPILACAVACVLACVDNVALAQQPSDSAKSRPLSRSDSGAKVAVDSAARAKRMKELQATNAQVPAAQQATGGSQGPTNPRMLPDFSAVGDLVGDLTRTGTTQADGARFSVREVEIAVQAVVDPYFRGDVFLGISDLEGISIEQAFLTSTALPHGLQMQLGRFLMPVGKQNTTHRHDLHTVEYPYVIQKFLSDDALKGTGVTLSKIFSPFGFYQELIVSAIDRFGDAPEGLTPNEAVHKSLSGMGYAARFRNYVDISQNTNFELSASAITGRRTEPLSGEISPGVNAINQRQSLLGADLTFRWKPLQQGLYKSFLLQAEVMQQVNPSTAPVTLPVGVTFAGPARNYTGAYVFARWQLTGRLYLGARYDSVQDPATAAGTNLSAGSALLEWFPSEFSKFVAQYERRSSSGETLNRILLQASFAVGPHKPHPF